jgi:hypothetical protein
MVAELQHAAAQKVATSGTNEVGCVLTFALISKNSTAFGVLSV